MDYQIYSEFGKRPRKNFDLETKDVGFNLTEILNQTRMMNFKEIEMAFKNSLKGLLNIEDIYQLIEELLKIENQLKEVRLRLKSLGEEYQEIPSIDNIYRKLSPVLLRAIQETNRDSLMSEIAFEWKEALKIVIEEEVFKNEQRKIL